MRLRLAYGRAGLDVELPDRNVVRVLRYRPSEPLGSDAGGAGGNGAPDAGGRFVPVPLADLARGRHSACVVVCDITRPVPNRVLLPPILTTLEQGGVPRDRTAHPGRHGPAPPQSAG